VATEIPPPFGANPNSSNTEGEGVLNYFWDFGKSAVSSLPELIGYKPSDEVEKFRQENPISGFASELLGTAVPYLGWIKGVSMVPKAAKALDAVSAISKSPWISGALRTGAELAPFEAARVGLSQVPGVGGDTPLEDMIGGAAINTLAGSGIGGVLHGIAAAGTRAPKLSSIFPGVEVGVPYPLQIRKMTEMIDNGTFTDPEKLGLAKMELRKTYEKARTEELSNKERYVWDIDKTTVPDNDTKGIRNQLNHLFQPTKNISSNESAIEVRRFAQGGDQDFPSRSAWEKAAETAQLPPNFEQDGQYFRHISFDQADKGAGKTAYDLNKRLTSKMVKVGDNDFLVREAENGMFVMARKVAGSIEKPTKEDSWVLFKTDQPGRFLPEAETWSKAQAELGKWTPGARPAADGGDVYNATNKFMADFPLVDYTAAEKTPGGFKQLITDWIPKNVRGIKDNEMVQRFGERLRETLSPRQFQFKYNPLANWIGMNIKNTFDRAETLVNEVMDGAVNIEPGKALLTQALNPNRANVEGLLGVRQSIAKSNRDNWVDEWKLMVDGKAKPADIPKLVANGQLHPESAPLWQNLAAWKGKIESDVNKVEEAAGRTPTKFPEDNYGWRRIWDGDTRVIIRGPDGKIVGLGSGANRKQALANANQLVADNKGWWTDGEYSISASAQEGAKQKFPKGMESIIHQPSWMLEKQGMKGYKYNTKPPTPEEFLADMEDMVRGNARYQASLATDDLLSVHMDRLHTDDPSAFRQLEARRNDYAGVQSSFSQLQNKITDKFLAPALGANSASKIAQITATSLFNFQLGAFRLAYPVVNALQFVQTVNPELAFILGKAPPGRLAGDYVHFAAGGTKGPVGGIASLNVMKVLGKSMREMINPDAELTAGFTRAQREGVVSPKIVEDYIGKARVGVTELGKAFSSPGNFAGWVRSLSEFLPTESERLSRAHAFTTGWITGRDYLERAGQKLDPNQLYQFARQFTERTMFSYTAADKPRIFNTPAGSMMGLFKNWMFNYMALMGQYSKEGVMHNNWSPLLWQTTGTFALGGVAATPMMFAADQASKYFLNKSAMELAYDQFGEGGDAVMLGLPAALTGVSLYSNVNSPISNPTRDAANLFGFAVYDRVKEAGKFVGGAFDKWKATGEHPGFSPEVRQYMMRAFAPATVYRSMAAMNPEEITQVGTGYPLVRDVSPVHRVLYGLGFNPTELDRGMAISQELYETKEKLKSTVKKLGDAWGDAELRGDSRQMDSILRQATIWGVDVGSVIQSGMRNVSKTRQDIVERQMSPQMIGKLRSVIEVQHAQENQLP
jgi:hypothetical protein